LTRVEEFGDAKLILGDCREVLEIKPHSVDFIFCGPPSGYSNSDGDAISIRKPALGLAKEGEVYASRPIPNDDPEEATALIEWLLNEATKSLVKGGCICCCSGGGGKDLALADWTQTMIAVPHLEFKQVIVWDKGPMGVGLHFRPSYEVILDARRKGAPCKWYDKTRKVENIIRPGQYSIYKITPIADQHPGEKPPELAADFIGLHTQPGELVLDPFTGAGSTGLAAIRLGRKFLGIGIDQHWFDVSCRKIEAEVRAKESGEDFMEALFG
jgi:DNA modification methylase